MVIEPLKPAAKLRTRRSYTQLAMSGVPSSHAFIEIDVCYPAGRVTTHAQRCRDITSYDDRREVSRKSRVALFREEECQAYRRKANAKC